MTKTIRKRYTQEFKDQTVKSIIEGGRTASSLSRDLGINENIIYRWKRKYIDQHTEKNNTSLIPQIQELKKLRRENKELREERDILKKALAIFSKNQK